MENIIDTFLSEDDKFLESISGNLESKESKETGDSRYIYQNELDKKCC